MPSDDVISRLLKRRAPKPAAKKKVLPFGERLVRTEVAAAKLGIHEEGGNNRGPWVRKFLAEVGLPEGYAWCAAAQSYFVHDVLGHKAPLESASVALIYAYGKAHGWLRAKPGRGMFVCFDFDGDGQYDDHIGLVVNVVKFGPILTLRTVEGNTSSGVSGSQADGDGLWLRTRIISARSCAFVALPASL